MAMQLTWPQHHWICLAEDEDLSAAGPPKNSGGVKGSVTWGLDLLHPEWAGRDGGIYAKENSRGNREVIAKKGDATKYWHLPALALTFS